MHREIYQNHLGYFVVVFDDTLGQSLVVSNNFIDFLLVEIFEFLHNRGDAKDFKTGMQSYDFYQVKILKEQPINNISQIIPLLDLSDVEHIYFFEKNDFLKE